MDANQMTPRRLRIVRLRRWVRPLLAAYESRLSGRLFAAGMVAGSILALATAMPPNLPLIWLIVWPLTTAVICSAYLWISVLELRLWRTLGLGAGLALHLLFVLTMTGGLILVVFPDQVLRFFWRGM